MGEITDLALAVGMPVALVLVVAGLVTVLHLSGVFRSIRIHASLGIWLRRARKHGASASDLKTLVMQFARADVKK
jgi:hypothetical protein